MNIKYDPAMDADVHNRRMDEAEERARHACTAEHCEHYSKPSYNGIEGHDSIGWCEAEHCFCEADSDCPQWCSDWKLKWEAAAAMERRHIGNITSKEA